MVDSYSAMLNKSLSDLFKNPLIIILSVILLIIQFLYAKVLSGLNFTQLTASYLNVNLVQILLSLPLLIPISIIYSGMIGLSLNAVKNKKESLWHYIKKFSWKNLIIILLILIIYNLINWISFVIVFALGKFIGLSANIAGLIFFLALFIGLVGILLFLAFASFFLVINNGIKKGITGSISFVKRNYLETLVIIVIIFVVNSLVNLLSFADILNAVLITPFIAVFLTRYLIMRNKQLS